MATLVASRPAAGPDSSTSTSRGKGQKQVCGPLRNLTTLYSKYRGDHKSKRSRFGYSLLGEGAEGLGRKRMDLETGEEYLLSPENRDPRSSDVEMKQMTPVWVPVAERVKDSIAKTKEKLGSLRKLQQRRLLRVFEEDGGKGDIEVELTTSSITTLLTQGERGVKELERYMTVEDRDVVLNMQKALATQLVKLSSEFKSMQRVYAKEIDKRQGGDLSSTSTTDVIDAGFTEDQLLELEGIESQVETRSVEITKIAKSINELNSIFKELAVLVVEQGTVLDRIDYNMENVVKDTAQATKELVKAEEMQKNSRVQKCILALVAFIIFNLLLITARA